MADPIRDALEHLLDRMMNERASSASVDAWAAEARAALSAQPPAPNPAVAMDALTRLYRWGGPSAEIGYSADVVIGVRNWIDGGMTGDLPPLPAWIADRCPPLLPAALAAAPADGPAVPEGREPAAVAVEPTEEDIENLAEEFYGDPVPAIRRALELWGHSATTSAPAAGEVGELAKWLYRLADQRTCNRRRGIRPHPSALTRVGVLMEQFATLLRQLSAAQGLQPVAVSEPPHGEEVQHG